MILGHFDWTFNEFFDLNGFEGAVVGCHGCITANNFSHLKPAMRLSKSSQSVVVKISQDLC